MKVENETMKRWLLLFISYTCVFSSFSEEVFLSHFTLDANENNWSSIYPEWDIICAPGVSSDIQVDWWQGSRTLLQFRPSPQNDSSIQIDDIVFRKNITATPNFTYTFEIYGTVIRSWQLSSMVFPVRVISQGQVIAATSFTFNNSWNAQTRTVSFDLLGLSQEDPNAILEIQVGGDYQRFYADYISLSRELNALDSDQDGLIDDDEINIHLTDPFDSDSDDDGLSDGDEVLSHSTNPNQSDSDSDGLSDGDEVLSHSTNPNQSDSDSDGLSDGLEVNTYLTNPALADSDGDSYNDLYEVTEGSDPNDYNELPPNDDFDDDGLTNNLEAINGTDPRNSDTDGDGLSDQEEVDGGSDPNNSNDPNQEPFRVELINMSSNSIILTDMPSEYIIDLNALAQPSLNIRLYPQTGITSSAEFKLNGRSVMVDNQTPFKMVGSGGSWLPKVGNYNLEIIERAQINGVMQIVAQTNKSISIINALDHRKRTIRLTTGASNDVVQIRMQKHLFPFGSMVEANPITQNNQNYKNTFLANFNTSVHGNAAKWYSNQPDWWVNGTPNGVRSSDADDVYDYLIGEGIPMRGHTFFWGMINNSQSSASNQMWDPDWVEARMNASPPDAWYWIEQRARWVASHWAGKIDEWDFNNEMGHGDWYRDTFTNSGPYGLTYLKQMTDWALEENPNLKIYHNDYGILNNNTFAFSYKNLLKTIESEGVPIDGIGVQGHFQAPPDAATVKASFDILDDFGVPIKITEFDCAIDDGDATTFNTDPAIEAAEADGLEMVYRIAFEHHAVAGILMWGFWESEHWRPEGALYYPNWDISPQGARYRELVYNEWWTDADAVTAGDGIVEFDVFAGEYQITVNGITHTTDVTAGYKPIDMDFSSGSISSTAEPEINLRKPVSENKYAYNEPIDFELDLIGDTALVQKVEFYVGDVKLKTDVSSPYAANWLDSIIGTNFIWAKTYYVDGTTESSKTNQITVLQAQANGNNLLLNGGFENFTSYWQAMGPISIAATIERNRSGNYSGRATGRTEEWHGLRTFDLRSSMLNDTVYNVSCYVQVASGVDVVGLKLKETKNGNTVPNYSTLDTATCNSTSWTRLEGQINITDLSQLSELFIYISGAPAGTVIYVDDAVLKAAPINNLDSDEDGIQDSWETYYFGSLENVSLETDYNNNSINDGLEFWQETYGSAGVLLPSIISPSLEMLNSQLNLSWPGESGVLYKIYTTSDLASGAWESSGNSILGSNELMSVTMTSTNNVEFIRVEVDQ